MNASHRYTASSGALIVGTEAAITSGGTSGNVGSYYGTVGLDGTAPGFNWTVNSDGTNGLNQNLTFNDVKIGNANQLRISISVGAGSASLQRYYQICDFVSSDFVDNAEDGECRGGGWRTLNLMRSPITNTSWTTYNFVVYDGYWTQNNTSNTPVSTPVSNFFHSSGSIVLRAYSTSAVATTHFIDYADIIPLIDPTYYPAGAAINDVDETIINTYYPTKAIDNSYLIADGITSVDFYLSYKNIRSFTGMNTLVLSTNYSCRQTVFLTTPLIPYIYNFNTSSWDAFDSNGDLMICTTNESFRTVQVSKSISSNHISSGEVRIRYYSLNGTATNTQVKIDQSYIILGSVNADDTKCETSFGTNANSTTCVKTRVLNEITSPNNWQVTSELESATLAHDYYGNDFDSDSATGESAISMNLSFPYSPPSNASVVFLGYALRYKSNSGSLTLQPQFKDNQGDNPTISGGWTNLSTANTSTTETYADHTTTGYFTNDPSDYYNQTNGLANLRFRTSASTTSSSVTAEVDFAMFTYSWIEDNQSIVTLQSHYQATGGQIGQGGTNNTIVANTTSGNTGSYKGTLAQDTTSPGYNWTVTNGTTINPGLDQQLFFDGVNLNGANKFQIVIRAASSNAALTRAYQICDWISTSSVDVAADANCTGGGWRTLNIRKANITTTTMTNFTWHIFNGYWTTGTTSNTPVSTPLANFVNTSNGNRVLIRAYSNYGTAAYTHTIDFARVTPLIDSTYMASSFTQLTGGTVTTSYINTNNGTLTGQSAADSVYLTVPGTASAISSFYTSYGGIKTYTGMNAIVVVSRYNCSTTGINITPKIYNFTTSSWENLTSATIACSTTIATNYFSITGTISNYISGSSVRIGWFGSANSTVSIRIDMQYIMLGSVNADTSTCGITFGTGTVADCKNTNDIDSASGTPNVWRITTEAESTSMSHAYYGLDNDGDATSGEQATSGRMKFPIAIPANSSPVYSLFSTRFTSGTTAFTVGPQFESRGFGNGWVTFSSTSTGSYVYSDSIISNSIYSPNNYLDTSSNQLALRIRTSASTLTTTSSTDIDFVMVSLSWSEGPRYTIDQNNFRVFNSLNTTDVGIPLAAQNSTATLLDDGQRFRIRMFLDVDTAQLPINSTFTLQFASKGAGTCASPSGMWTAVGTTSAIAYYNGTPSDGATITVNAYDPTSTRTINYQTYEELNSVSNTKSAIPAGQTGMWDYSLIDYSAPGNTTYCFRLLDAYTTAGSPTYSNYPSIKTPRGNPPDDPGKLEQTETSSNLSIMEGGWIDTQSVRYSATSYDPDGPLDTVYLCYERQLISVPFTYVDTACSSGFPGDSSYIYVVDSSIPANSEYHWQVRIKDSHSNYSAWVSFGTNLETARDFGIDITAPTALSVYDGTSAGIDVMFNDGSLSSLSGNWANVNAEISGLKEYLYSIGTTPGSSDIKGLTNVGLSTSATATGLTLKSSQMYYFNVFVNDNAGNQGVFSSDGQRVQPTLSFSLSNYSVIFDNLNAANDLTNTQATVITTSTNAYNGYRIRLWQWEDLASIENPSVTIAPFDGGVVIGTTVSDSNGLFVKELFALTPGVHHVEIYSTDPLNNVSNTINIPALLLPKQTTIFTNIFLPPTISINQNYFVENEIIEISGYTYPNAVLQITIIGDSFYRYTINADENGKYIISLPSSNFPNLNYSTYANLFINGIIDNSTQSQVLFFTINGVYITPSVTITPLVSITTSPGFTVTIEYPSDTPDITFEPSIITYIPTQKPTEYPTITPTIAVQPIISYELFLRCLYISIPLGIFTYFIFFILKQSKKAQIYILSGPGKTGTSYISHRILKDNKFEFLYIGSILKQKSIQAGFVKSGYKIPEDPDDFDLDKADIKGFRDNCVLIGRDVDKELDSYMIKRIIKAIDDKSKILIDSKILPLFMFSNSFKKFLLEELTSQNKADLFESYYNFIFENSKAVWLHTNLEVRAKRSLLKTLSKENLTEDLIRKEMLSLSKRQIADRQDYIRRYNLVDYPEPNKLPTNFKGTIIDSTELNGEETYKLVKKAFKLKGS